MLADWLAVCQRGYSLEFLVIMGSIQDPQGQLTAILNHGPGYVDSFWRVDLWAGLYQATFYSGVGGPSLFPRTEQVSIDPWPLLGWMVSMVTRLGFITNLALGNQTRVSIFCNDTQHVMGWGG
jgi:hypothetical protein